MREKIEFPSQGVILAGLLERPVGEIGAYALFAHCFTCGKDIAAASRISRALVQQGIAVLRFDFTGLGNSDGDFANTNFSSNLDDLKAAADFLRDEYDAPQLLIGHSLGGAAVLAIANQIPESKAVVTIGAPASPEHVEHNFAASMDEIKSQGLAHVNLGPRQFTIKKQFIDDLAQHAKQGFTLDKKALLVMHSPVDDTVSIDQAESIYTQAKHPKSFVSLDSANHLLTNKVDADYVANVIASWSSRYLDFSISPRSLQKVASGHLLVEERDHKFTQTIISDSHTWLADEPLEVGGKNLGPDPYEHLLAALGACTSMTMRMYAERKKWPLQDIKIDLTHNRTYIQDCENCESGKGQLDTLTREIELIGDLSNEQKQALLAISEKCPVHKTLHSKLVVTTELKN
ncbi:bifunctional alpha/beta hydrolase/OsmC family protein [Shewanella sp. D64]|uniref:bifunctional alpha/beta hydrolase/OsmC family protein n=1 Tax=unclassified Shewanella TaxID=196818 RepID=UPI0022BA1CF3|nr:MULTISPECIES: bifunctional alpha/beta hydrolase/OsmC family protein [unclassified Shewanella]MEC4724598.1 bifunctional alpha/beta hydrolase/OsmC family protein [Shewanella sp. D64]MEC4736625.1 bifunctional alpha/beta hydrolase/OsmC family protein [Shewanella sp. E94]WBJ94703.1 bifunctional alpha/beta hydrolase/OsmC family protein [Shewanella sp. MTB7]